MDKSALVEKIKNRIDGNFSLLKESWQKENEVGIRFFVLDDILPDDICLRIYNSFPKDGSGFFSRESFREKKKTSSNLNTYDVILSDITYAIHDSSVVDLISKITDFDKLEPDPKLYAGGLSMMFKGDFLNLHIDNSHDSSRKKYRRLNLLYYVSPDWEIEYGGNLELWDKFHKKQITIQAKFNRLIVMETNKTSWHSVSSVTVDSPRCCVSNYFFSETSPTKEDYFHVTSFVGRPGQNYLTILGAADNFLRNSFSKIFKYGRGKNLINK